MTRLLHVTTTDISLSLLLGPQLEAFAGAGYEVHAASVPGPFSERLPAGVTHHPLHRATRAVAPHRDAAAFAELFALIRRLRPDIVHTHNPKPGLYGRVAARLAGVPLIVNTQHGLFAQPHDRRRRRWPVYALERAAAACSDVELVQNHEDVAVLAHLGVARRKLWLLGNGIDLARFRPPSPTERTAARVELGIGPDQVAVGAVGRLVREKGYGDFFAAAHALSARHPQAVFLAVGPDDPEKADALSRAEVDRAISDGVRVLGMRHDVERVYAALDVYVLASRREGFPRSAMEAAAMALPIVASDIRGCRQVVEDGRTGLLVPPADPAGLAGAIEALLVAPDRRGTLGRAGAAKARREFDQHAVIETTLKAYALLSRQPPPGSRRGRSPGPSGRRWRPR